ncbi:MAG: pyruvate kinase [bacterium]
MTFDPASEWERRTSIVATLGPATNSPDRIRALIDAGVDVVRLNFAHGTADEHARACELVREAEAATGRSVAVLQDLAGPKVRVGDLPGGAIELREDQRLVIVAGRPAQPGRAITTSHARLSDDVSKGDRLLLDDGALELVVEDSRNGEITTRVVRGGTLAEHKGINLPGVALNVPVLTEKDVRDLEIGIGLGVDYVALSFVQREEDIALARRALADRNTAIPLIAKLERAGAISALDQILQEADGVMVARGDLGVEMAAEVVPVLQKTIIRKANAAGIPVITATQMLESMVHHSRPTRAETSDVANAILDGTDALMLSAETAVGEYPIEAVQMMDRIARVVEAEPFDGAQGLRPDIFGGRTRARAGTAQSVARAACTLAHELKVRAIVVITRTGRTAELLSKNRPSAPMIAFTEQHATARRLALWWGIRCFATTFRDDTDEMIAHLERELLRRELAVPGDAVILVGSTPVIVRGRTNFLKVHRVKE